MRIVAAACVAGVLFAAGGCTSESPTPDRESIALRFSTGAPGGGFYPIGRAITDALNALSGAPRVAIKPSEGAVDNVRAVQEGHADIGLVFADVAYLAYLGGLAPGTSPFDQLRAIALLQLTPVQLVARRGAGIESVADLRGKRVGVGPSGSGTSLTAGLILRAFDVEPESVRTEALQFSDAGQRVTAGTLDAMFDNAIHAESVSRALQHGAKLVPIEGAAVDRLRRTYPFLRITSIPRETYPGVGHVPTVGVDSVLICRRDIDEQIVHDLTARLFEVLPNLQGTMRRNLTELVDAAATPIPLHDGAARFYREQELLR